MTDRTKTTTAARPVARVGEVTFTPPAYAPDSSTTRGSAVVLPGPRVLLVVQTAPSAALIDRTVDLFTPQAEPSAATNGHLA